MTVEPFPLAATGGPSAVDAQYVRERDAEQDRAENWDADEWAHQQDRNALESWTDWADLNG